MSKQLRSLALALALAVAGSASHAQAPEARDSNAVVQAASRSGPRFDVDVDEAPARAFFMGLVDGTRYNMLVDPRVSGRVSVKLKQVTIEEVLDAMRDLYGYDYRRISTGYMVLPATLQTRVFHLNYLDLQRFGTSKTRVSSGQVTEGGYAGGSGGGASSQAATTSAEGPEGAKDLSGTAVLTRNESDFWKSVEIDLKLLVGGEQSKDGWALKDRSVVINRQSGVIVARAYPSELRDVADYLKRTEAAVGRQVVLEAKVIEVELSDAYQAGINWASVVQRGNDHYLFGQMSPPGGFGADLGAPTGNPVTVAPGNPLSGFVTNTLGGAFAIAADFADFNAFIELLGLQGKTRVLSSPRVSTLQNQKAIIKAGTDEFFITGVHSDTTTGTATTTSVEYDLTAFFSGVALDVTPQISDDNTVLMHIHPTISDVNDQQKSLSVRGQTDILPLALSQIRESDSIVKAKSGQVIVIGGLMREQHRRQNYKTPLLGDIPLLGKLFKSTRDTNVTTELVILLRPLVVNDDDWTKLVQEPQDRMDQMVQKK
jgi:MSHA biogenesis protein MshL